MLVPAQSGIITFISIINCWGTLLHTCVVAELRSLKNLDEPIDFLSKSFSECVGVLKVFWGVLHFINHLYSHLVLKFLPIELSAGRIRFSGWMRVYGVTGLGCLGDAEHPCSGCSQRINLQHLLLQRAGGSFLLFLHSLSGRVMGINT